MSNRSTHRWPRHWQCYPDKQANVTHLISSAGWHANAAVRARCADFSPAHLRIVAEVNSHALHAHIHMQLLNLRT